MSPCTMRRPNSLMPALVLAAAICTGSQGRAEFKPTTEAATHGQVSPKAATEPSYQELIGQGAAAFEAKDFENARIAFSKAYELQPTAEALLNLALAEINLKRFVDGIRHLRAYVRMPTVPPAQAASVREALLTKAYSKIARISVNVPDGSVVQVDDRSEAAKAGEDETIVVMPGAHKLRAADGRTVEFTAEAGGVVALTLPAPQAARTVAAAVSPPSAAPARMEPYPSPTAAEPEGSASNKRTIVLTIGAGVTLVALGVGAYFFAKEASDQEDIDARRQDLHTKYGTPNSCLEGRVGAQDPWCSELSDLVSTRVREQNIATASLIAAGVAGAGTLAAFFLWPRNERRPDTGIVFTPVIAREGIGINLRGRY